MSSYGARFSSRRGSGDGSSLSSPPLTSMLVSSDSVAQAQSLLARFGKPAAVAALFGKAGPIPVPSPPGPPSDPRPVSSAQQKSDSTPLLQPPGAYSRRSLLAVSCTALRLHLLLLLSIGLPLPMYVTTFLLMFMVSFSGRVRCGKGWR